MTSFRRVRGRFEIAGKALSLLAALLVTLTSGIGLIRCTERDGCTSIEIVAASGGDCRGCVDEQHESRSLPRPDSGGSSLAGADCSCVDVPLLVHSGARFESTKRVTPPAPVLFHPTSEAVADLRDGPIASSRFPARPARPIGVASDPKRSEVRLT